MREPGRGDVRHDVRVIGLVGAAHFVSHFFQLLLPPLFPLLRAEFEVSWVALGLLTSVLYATSGIGQTISGFLVDRFGAGRVLVSGLALLAGSMVLIGLSLSYPMLLAVAALAGLGNSVFHPADYAILNGAVSPRRLGRGYSVHTISGNLGWAAAPAFVVTLAAAIGWRAAVMVAGLLGLGVTLLLATRRHLLATGPPARAARARDGGFGAQVRLLLTAPILAAFAYFTLLSTALIGIQTFAVAALSAIYGLPLALATGALTGFLLGGAAGILLGGVLADRTTRHHRVASAGLVAGALLSLAIASASLPGGLVPVVLGLTGFALGATSPSRDMLVRAATPPGASGRVFGFVYSGLDVGSALTPLLLGWLLDRGEPRAIFAAVAALMALTIVTVLQVRRHGQPETAVAPARA